MVQGEVPFNFMIINGQLAPRLHDRQGAVPDLSQPESRLMNFSSRFAGILQEAEVGECAYMENLIHEVAVQSIFLYNHQYGNSFTVDAEYSLIYPHERLSYFRDFLDAIHVALLREDDDPQILTTPQSIQNAYLILFDIPLGSDYPMVNKKLDIISNPVDPLFESLIYIDMQLDVEVDHETARIRRANDRKFWFHPVG